MNVEWHKWVKRTATVLTVFWLATPLQVWPSYAAEKVTVFAAASLKNAIDDVAAAWKADTGKDVTASYAASSALAKQIESGAPADIFISADLDWMDYLAEKKLINEATRKSLLGNSIVLVAPKDNAEPVEIKKGLDLSKLIGDGRLAMGAVDTVPAGKYGKAALESLGIWPSVESRIAGAESVRAALLLVSRGEAPYGIVYKTDAAADKEVAIVGTFPEDSHKPIVYPIAVLADSKNADAISLLDYIKSDKAVPLFEKQGFTVLK
ncbi:molybdate ABC transporter substrate-binding protein [Phyllobacterium sp. YR531]|uniref:molybdate ABC transporter substrate-binding protein n=1 Tax=Phyllobacterium sp. YR531 TaxID=1144343 RepID=UPI00026F7E99|nr:molybdate ABC transporter substrate-binding protein [Phyllobacterium sp. YR531]EJN01677.1 molybdenum ABC transporter, periplasmic molybdate-binding protein [Phyllobacterium sp. YR531]